MEVSAELPKLEEFWQIVRLRTGTPLAWYRYTALLFNVRGFGLLGLRLRTGTRLVGYRYAAVDAESPRLGLPGQRAAYRYHLGRVPVPSVAESLAEARFGCELRLRTGTPARVPVPQPSRTGMQTRVPVRSAVKTAVC